MFDYFVATPYNHGLINQNHDGNVKSVIRTDVKPASSNAARALLFKRQRSAITCQAGENQFCIFRRNVLGRSATCSIK